MGLADYLRVGVAAFGILTGLLILDRLIAGLMLCEAYGTCAW